MILINDPGHNGTIDCSRNGVLAVGMSGANKTLELPPPVWIDQEITVCRMTGTGTLMVKGPPDTELDSAGMHDFTLDYPGSFAILRPIYVASGVLWWKIISAAGETRS